MMMKRVWKKMNTLLSFGSEQTVIYLKYENIAFPLDLIPLYLLWYSDCQKGAYYHKAVHLIIMQGGIGGNVVLSESSQQRPTPGAVLQPCMATTTKNFLSAYFSPYMVRHPIRFSFVPLQAVHHVGCGRFEFRWGAECQIFRLLRMTKPLSPRGFLRKKSVDKKQQIEEFFCSATSAFSAFWGSN